MKAMWMTITAVAVLLTLAAPAMAEDAAEPTAVAEMAALGDPASSSGWGSVAMVGACLGAGVIVIGGGIGIARVSTKALESIARQPEAAGQMFLAWLIPAAMIEGAMLFGVVICLLVLVG